MNTMLSEEKESKVEKETEPEVKVTMIDDEEDDEPTSIFGLILGDALDDETEEDDDDDEFEDWDEEDLDYEEDENEEEEEEENEELL